MDDEEKLDRLRVAGFQPILIADHPLYWLLIRLPDTSEDLQLCASSVQIALELGLDLLERWYACVAYTRTEGNA